MNNDRLEVRLQNFESEDYMYKFNIKKRSKSFGINGIRYMNGESIFGPHETWPAQLQDFTGYIAEQVKSDNIKLNNSTFSKNNLINLLENHKNSLFRRNYSSEKEVESTFTGLIKYLELGIMIGSIEKSISKEFDELPILKQKYFKTFKKAGRKYIDNICEDKGHNKNIEIINNSSGYLKLHILKYEALDRPKK